MQCHQGPGREGKEIICQRAMLSLIHLGFMHRCIASFAPPPEDLLPYTPIIRGTERTAVGEHAADTVDAGNLRARLRDDWDTDLGPELGLLCVLWAVLKDLDARHHALVPLGSDPLKGGTVCLHQLGIRPCVQRSGALAAGQRAHA